MTVSEPPRQLTISTTRRELTLFLVAGEHSGDALGARLMARLNAEAPGRIRYLGVGGERMRREGLESQFPLSDVAVMGPLSILPRLPRIVRRVYGTAAAAVSAAPDALVIIDSPEFTHPIAKRVRRRRPTIPIIDYVSPSVWAWRPGRAARMRRYVDHVLALLPFEPAAHARLGGPPCSYVGHPLIERLPWIEGLDPAPLATRLGLTTGKPVLVLLPGSRRSEVTRLLPAFGDAVRDLAARGIHPEVVVPVVDHVRDLVMTATASWASPPHLIEGDEDKFRAFKLADAALAASGTVTLELALAGTPMVVAYRMDAVAWSFRFLMKAHSIVLANLVLAENVFPEFLQERADGPHLAAALAPLFSDTRERAAQRAALGRIPGLMRLDGDTPSAAAARIVLEAAERGRRS